MDSVTLQWVREELNNEGWVLMERTLSRHGSFHEEHPFAVMEPVHDDLKQTLVGWEVRVREGEGPYDGVEKELTDWSSLGVFTDAQMVDAIRAAETLVCARFGLGRDMSDTERAIAFFDDKHDGCSAEFRGVLSSKEAVSNFMFNADEEDLDNRVITGTFLAEDIDTGEQYVMVGGYELRPVERIK